MVNKQKKPVVKKQEKLVVLRTEKPDVRYPEQFNTIYANFSSFMLTNSDLTIDFGIKYTQNINDKFMSIVNMHTRIIMSPQQTKEFVNKLNGLIDHYEKDFGEITIESKDQK